MEVEIPKEYRDHFDDVAYITRWKKPTLLLMNRKEKDDLERIFDESRVCSEDGIVRFIKAGIVDVKIKGRVLDIPSVFVERLEGGNRAFNEEKLGIMLS